MSIYKAKWLILTLIPDPNPSLGLKGKPASGSKPSLNTLRRLKKIEELPSPKQKALFKTIDNFLKGAEKE
jgi:hypothetical protein